MTSLKKPLCLGALWKSWDRMAVSEKGLEVAPNGTLVIFHTSMGGTGPVGCEVSWDHQNCSASWSCCLTDICKKARFYFSYNCYIVCSESVQDSHNLVCQVWSSLHVCIEAVLIFPVRGSVENNAYFSCETVFSRYYVMWQVIKTVCCLFTLVSSPCLCVFIS